jgi:hypothetical protein
VYFLRNSYWEKNHFVSLEMFNELNKDDSISGSLHIIPPGLLKYD